MTPNYPHEEVQNPGVNHFPQGVFQKCRTVLLREKEEERERLKRIRRMRAKSPVKMSAIVPTNTDLWTAGRSVDGSVSVTTANQLFATTAAEVQLVDQFDQEWDRALAESSIEQRSFQRHRLNTR